jgi:hypothetical protein
MTTARVEMLVFIYINSSIFDTIDDADYLEYFDDFLQNNTEN